MNTTSSPAWLRAARGMTVLLLLYACNSDNAALSMQDPPTCGGVDEKQVSNQPTEISVGITSHGEESTLYPSTANTLGPPAARSKPVRKNSERKSLEEDLAGDNKTVATGIIKLDSHPLEGEDIIDDVSIDNDRKRDAGNMSCDTPAGDDREQKTLRTTGYLPQLSMRSKMLLGGSVIGLGGLAWWNYHHAYGTLCQGVATDQDMEAQTCHLFQAPGIYSGFNQAIAPLSYMSTALVDTSVDNLLIPLMNWVQGRVKINQARRLSEQGAKHLKHGEYEEAENTYSKAIELWEELSEEYRDSDELAEMHYGLGRALHFQGKYEEAVAAWVKAAAQGRADAQYNLGDMYYYGRGVAQSYKQAVVWYEKAANQGYADAQNNLGWMYIKGRGVEQDNEEAVKWYHKAAEQGNAQAQTHLAWLYFEGIGAEKDYKKAYEWI
ncbi:MAG: tetratricopeptide repeat protein, partial [Bacteroidota bacterium]